MTLEDNFLFIFKVKRRIQQRKLQKVYDLNLNLIILSLFITDLLKNANNEIIIRQSIIILCQSQNLQLDFQYNESLFLQLINQKQQRIEYNTATHQVSMKRDSLYQFIFHQLSKSSVNRMSLTNFNRIIRKKVQDVSSSQLLYSYRQLQKLKSNNPQFHTNSNPYNHYQRSKNNNKSTIMKIQSYQKHTLICLEEIAMKLKQKNGFEEGVDLTKLLYLRLLNAIQYNLPYFQILEQFKQQFFVKQVGQEIVDYVQIISKDPANLNNSFKETVEIIIDMINQQIQSIQILKLPFVKSQLSKAYSYGIYQKNQNLIKKIDSIICKNKYVFTYKQLQSCISSQQKNNQIYQLFALMSKDLIQKRLYYLHLNQMNSLITGSTNQQNNSLLQLPGKLISQQNISQVIQKINQVQIYKPYINIFSSFIKEEIPIQTNYSLAHQFINYNFIYIINSGNEDLNGQYIFKVLKNTFFKQENKSIINLKNIKYYLLRFQYILLILMRQKLDKRILINNNECLKKQIDQLTFVQNLNRQNYGIVFQQTIQNYNKHSQLYQQSVDLLCQLLSYLKSQQEKSLIEIINQELDCLSNLEKFFLTQEIISWTINHIKHKQFSQQVEFMGLILQNLNKNQFKKFSQQFSNIQKIISLSKIKIRQSMQAQNSSSSSGESKSKQNKNTQQTSKKSIFQKKYEFQRLMEQTNNPEMNTLCFQKKDKTLDKKLISRQGMLSKNQYFQSNSNEIDQKEINFFDILTENQIQLQKKSIKQSFL